jgi:hypothetical protein
MFRACFIWTAACLTVALACCARAQVRAGDGPGNAVLKKHGLKIAGSLAVADEESEIKTKLSDARRLSKQLSYSLMQQQGTMSPEELQKTVKTLGTQINQLRSEMNAVNQQMNQVPRSANLRYGRFGGGGMSFANNEAAEIYEELLVYRTQLQAEITQDSYFLDQLKNQPGDPKAKERIDSEVKERRDAYHQALVDLRKLVDSATAKYDELAKDDEVKKTLNVLGKGLREKPKLGPSREFLTNIKLLEKLEKAEASGETEPSPAKTGRKIRHGTRTKHSSKSANGAGDSEGSQ